MNNSLLEIQEIIMRELKRIDNAETDALKSEVARSNAISNNANTFDKSINVSLRVMEMSKKYDVTKEAINKEIGV